MKLQGSNLKATQLKLYSFELRVQKLRFVIMALLITRYLAVAILLCIPT